MTHFGPTLSVGRQMVPHTDKIRKMPYFGPTWSVATKWSHIQAELLQVNFLHAILGTTLTLTELQLPMEWAI